MKKKIKKFLTIISPKLETKINYRISFGKKLDLKNPKTINEKILWLKLNTYNNNDIITKCVDKYRVREYIKEKKLNIKVPKLIGVYNSASEIDWNSLPNSFVIKCNHGCGFNIIVHDKKRINISDSIKLLNKWMKTDYWKIAAEIQYKKIEKKIIIEEFLGDVKTYKFYCFNGVPKVMYIGNNEWKNGTCPEDKYIDYFDMSFNHIDCRLGNHPNYPGKIKKPSSFNNMIKLSKELSKDFPFVRIDLYEVDGENYLSEFTFVPTAGYMKIEPSTYLDEWGAWLKLDNK